MKKEKKQKPHYVDNKKFLQAMIDWRETWPDEENIPPVTGYIGECFLKIATHLSYRPNFINYTYREDMISDGIENCLQYVENFNPEKSGFFSMLLFRQAYLQHRNHFGIKLNDQFGIDSLIGSKQLFFCVYTFQALRF